MKPVFESRTCGKLLLTSEYAVLCGVPALSLATKFGQSLQVFTKSGKSEILWQACDENDHLWFEAQFNLNDFSITKTTNNTMAKLLCSLLKHTDYAWLTDTSYIVKTQLDFNKNWGLGSSSTLIANVAMWTNCDAFDLLAGTFGGSGFDVATAMASTHIIYQNKPLPDWVKTEFNPYWKDDVLFIYSGTKRISRQAIAGFNCEKITPLIADTLAVLTQRMLKSNNLEELEEVIETHEQIIGKLIGAPALKTEFADFNGSLKSLGAWGGDFFMATGKEKSRQYFANKGFNTMFTWDEIILQA